jgi:hypothetical protein
MIKVNLLDSVTERAHSAAVVEEKVSNPRARFWLLGAAVFGLLAVVLILFAVAYALDLVLPTWLSFLIVGVLLLVLAGLLALVGVLVACCRPAGVGLDAWALAALAFGLGPRRLAWARPEPPTADWRQASAPDWAELDLELGWNRPEADTLHGPAGWQAEARP